MGYISIKGCLMEYYEIFGITVGFFLMLTIIGMIVKTKYNIESYWPILVPLFLTTLSAFGFLMLVLHDFFVFLEKLS